MHISVESDTTEMMHLKHHKLSANTFPTILIRFKVFAFNFDCFISGYFNVKFLKVNSHTC